MMRIHTKALAVSCGLVAGALVFVKTVLGVFFSYGTECLDLLASVYPGYSVSLVGSVIGLIYGFLGGAIVGGLIGWTYNRLFVRI